MSNLTADVKEMLQVRMGGYRPPLTYRPSFTQVGLPPFTLHTVEWMRRDPQIRLGMAIKAAPFHKVRLTIKGDPEVTTFMVGQIRRFWQRAVPKIQNGFWYTLSGGEIVYKTNEQTGRYEFWSYNDIYPADLSILHTLRESIPVGISIKQTNQNLMGLGGTATAYSASNNPYAPEKNQSNQQQVGGTTRLFFPKSFLYIHRREFGSLVGQSEFEAAYDPWMEKNDNQGAKHSRKLWFFKNAFGGGILLHPPGNYKTPTGEEIPYYDIARQAMETSLNGAVWCLENIKGPDGDPLWSFIDPAIRPGGKELLDYVSALDNEMLRGMTIPDDVVQQTTGGGLNSGAGRSVPLMAFFISHESTLDNLFNVADEQVFRPLCRANFGHANYEATVDVDIETIMGTMQDGTPGQAENPNDPNNPQAQVDPNNPNAQTDPYQQSGNSQQMSRIHRDSNGDEWIEQEFDEEGSVIQMGHSRILATPDYTYIGNQQSDPMFPSVRVRYLVPRRVPRIVIPAVRTEALSQINPDEAEDTPEDTADDEPIQLSIQHEPAKQQHRNRSGKVSKGGQFTESTAGSSTTVKKQTGRVQTPAARNQTSQRTASQKTPSRQSPAVEAGVYKPRPRQIPSPKTKSELAKAAHVMVDGEIQRYAEEHNESVLAKLLGGVSHPDHEPKDISTETALVELKTIFNNSNQKLTMDSYSQIRKVVEETNTGKAFHTIVFDDTRVMHAKGPGKHDPSKRVCYYRRGIAGSARIGTMHRCTMAELKLLVKMDDADLPSTAQRTDQKHFTGKWVSTIDPETGRKAFKNSKTKKIVVAKS